VIRKLDPAFVRNVQPSDQLQEFWDEVVRGLSLRVFPKPSTAKSWALRYRVNRRQRRLTLGDVSLLSLPEARAKAKAAMREVDKSIDPAEEKRTRRDALTVGEFADVYIERYAKRKKKSWRNDQSQLKTEILPTWEHRLMQDIKRPDVNELLQDIAERGPILANRVRSLLHKMFNYAIASEVVEFNPVAKTERPGVEVARDRVLTADEIRKLWRACTGIAGAAFKFQLATAQRQGEVFDAKWSDVNLDEARWTIPSTSAKNKLSHKVFLNTVALDILRELRLTANPDKEPFIFAGERGKRERAALATKLALDDFKAGKDIRRTAATILGENGIDRFVIGRVLNHVEKSITRVYDRASYDPQKRVASDTLGRVLTQILENKKASVLAFAR